MKGYYWNPKTPFPIDIYKWFNFEDPPSWQEMATHRIQGIRYSGKCIAGDTLVHTYKGDIPIKDISVGQLIHGDGDEMGSGGVAAQRVVALHRSRRPALEVKTVRGLKLICSPEHKLFKVGDGWTEAVHLLPNDPVYTHLVHGRQWFEVERIAQVTPLGYEEEMCDITTSEGRYYAGGFLVHNSALLEAICGRYHQHGSTVYDAFSANDNEGLAVLRSAWASHVTLVTGNNIKLKSNFNSEPIRNIHPTTAPNDIIYCFAKAFFASETEYYSALTYLTKEFERRDTFNPHIPHVIGIREAQEYVASKLRTNQVRTSRDANEAFVKFHNSMYHHGYAVVADQQREVEAQKNLRELTTYTYLKKFGNMEIPRRFYHLLRHINPDGGLRALKPWQFYIYTQNGALGKGRFMLPPWHIVRGEGILDQLDIKVFLIRPEATNKEGNAIANVGVAQAVQQKDIPIRPRQVEYDPQTLMNNASQSLVAGDIANVIDLLEQLEQASDVLTKVETPESKEMQRKIARFVAAVENDPSVKLYKSSMSSSVVVPIVLLEDADKVMADLLIAVSKGDSKGIVELTVKLGETIQSLEEYDAPEARKKVREISRMLNSEVSITDDMKKAFKWLNTPETPGLDIPQGIVPPEERVGQQNQEEAEVAKRVEQQGVPPATALPSDVPTDAVDITHETIKLMDADAEVAKSRKEEKIDRRVKVTPAVCARMADMDSQGMKYKEISQQIETEFGLVIKRVQTIGQYVRLHKARSCECYGVSQR